MEPITAKNHFSLHPSLNIPKILVITGTLVSAVGLSLALLTTLSHILPIAGTIIAILPALSLPVFAILSGALILIGIGLLVGSLATSRSSNKPAFDDITISLRLKNHPLTEKTEKAYRSASACPFSRIFLGRHYGKEALNIFARDGAFGWKIQNAKAKYTEGEHILLIIHDENEDTSWESACKRQKKEAFSHKVDYTLCVIKNNHQAYESILKKVISGKRNFSDKEKEKVFIYHFKYTERE